jgi:hypothetical protein
MLLLLLRNLRSNIRRVDNLVEILCMKMMRCTSVALYIQYSEKLL